MENNSLILGSIPGCSGGIRKTYSESIIRYIDFENKKIVNYALNNNYTMREKLYIKKETNDIYVESEIEEENEDLIGFKEVEILSIYPLAITSQYGTHYEFIIEVIEKDILYRHLRDERILKDNELKLTLK